MIDAIVRLVILIAALCGVISAALIPVAVALYTVAIYFGIRKNLAKFKLILGLIGCICAFPTVASVCMWAVGMPVLDFRESRENMIMQVVQVGAALSFLAFAVDVWRKRSSLETGRCFYIVWAAVIGIMCYVPVVLLMLTKLA